MNAPMHPRCLVGTICRDGKLGFQFFPLRNEACNGMRETYSAPFGTYGYLY